MGLSGLHSRRRSVTHSMALPVTREGWFQQSQPVPTPASPNQPGFSSKMLLQNKFIIVISKKDSDRELEIALSSLKK